MWAQARVRVLTEDGLLVFLSAALVIQFELLASESRKELKFQFSFIWSSTLCLFHTRLCLGGPETTAGACRSTKVGSP